MAKQAKKMTKDERTVYAIGYDFWLRYMFIREDLS